ncbi:uncharacterized protein PV07_09964 [Cladophialophora immunda]|uniref:Heterokaryon incompatibility domain-containing protein n=1 Tax=Cladophialophora immunda TaxID=569365 RepID=A0A0D1Z994_9EURO|nr:uncharacterized protein PV07_09964 [Cladophialophora immunda]KIW24236.1 hypothetical protein PV07_09964 [Cladophialophora immunda]
MAAAGEPLCSTCRSVDWMDAGLPRVVHTDAPELFTTSTEVRLLDGTVAPAAAARLVESALFLVSLGTVQELRARSAQCPCCAFCHQLLERRFEAADIDRAAGERVPVHVYTRKYGAVVVGDRHGRDGQEQEGQGEGSPRATHLMCFSLSFHPHFHHGESASFALLGRRQQMRGKETVPSFVGRLVSPRFDLAQVRGWLETCELQHSPARTAESFLSRSGKTTELRVVDVSQRCLKTLSIQDIDGGYAALSYVWGVAEQDVRLTTANLAAYSRPGGIPRLSQTVEDAMQVARAVGIRYFWANVISILQDDDEDKAQNIFDMDVIYTYSRLTVAAVAGTNCHEGLPGVSSDRLPLLHTSTAQFGLVEIPHQPERSPASLSASGGGWPSRAWTLQEFLLSRQTLLFCDQQVIWVCRAADWAEGLDVAEERFRFAKYDGLNRPRLESSLFAEEQSSDAIGVIDDGSAAHPGLEEQQPRPADLSDAATLVECYTRRKLSYESDIKNALEGLMWYISSMTPGSSFVWGLPEPHFEAFLCWGVRGGPSATRGVVKRRRAFAEAPSWSWMAWLGQVVFPRFASRAAHGHGWRSCVKCFRYPTYLHRQGRAWNDIPSGYDAGATVLARPYDMWTSGLPLRDESAGLVFWALCASALVDAASLEIHYERHASSIRVPARQKRLRVQDLCVSEDVAERIAQAGHDAASVAVILVAVAVEGARLPSSQDILAASDRNSQLKDEERGESDEDPPGVVFEIWDRAVHCLVLSRGDEDGHFCREGTLSIKMDDWLRLEKERELVVLD